MGYPFFEGYGEMTRDVTRIAHFHKAQLNVHSVWISVSLRIFYISPAWESNPGRVLTVFLLPPLKLYQRTLIYLLTWKHTEEIEGREKAILASALGTTENPLFSFLTSNSCLIFLGQRLCWRILRIIEIKPKTLMGVRRSIVCRSDCREDEENRTSCRNSGRHDWRH